MIKLTFINTSYTYLLLLAIPNDVLKDFISLALDNYSQRPMSNLSLHFVLACC